MNKRKQWYLISYDIADSRRLQCFHRYIKKRAYALQYSVFIGYFNQPEWVELLRQLNKRIRQQTDSLHCYRLTEMDMILCAGNPAFLPEVFTEQRLPIAQNQTIDELQVDV